MRKVKGWAACIAVFLLLCIIGCVTNEGTTPPAPTDTVSPQTSDVNTQTEQTDVPTPQENVSEIENEIPPLHAPEFDLSTIPAFSGKAYVAVNHNIPYFTEAEHTTVSFEQYSRLDAQGRCSVAFANIGTDIMPTEERGNIGAVKPTGWHTVKYDNVDGKYLYNRCHLIGYQLTGENANERNLITGTRYMNTQGMLPFENMVADYIKETNNHVLYRVTPIFEADNLLASGVLMEALSMEDNGEGICFNVFCYNEQPGIYINHTTGDSRLKETATEEKQSDASAQNMSYIGNKNTKKFHYTYCSSVKKMKESNKVYLECSRAQAVSQGYSPCGNCKP